MQEAVAAPLAAGKEAIAVTTVDVYIRKGDGSASFSLHTGLFGSATTVLHVLISKFQDGTIRRHGPCGRDGA